MHPWLKAVRLENGDLIFNCPLSGGDARDYALSPKEDGDLCSLRSKDQRGNLAKIIFADVRGWGKDLASTPNHGAAARAA